MFKAIGGALLALMFTGGVFVANPALADAIREQTSIAPAIRSIAGFDESLVVKTYAELEAREVLNGFTSIVESWTSTIAEAADRIASGDDPTTRAVDCGAEVEAFTAWANALMPTPVVCYEFETGVAQ